MSHVEDQHAVNSCVGNAIAQAYEYYDRKTDLKHIDISRLDIYYWARAVRGWEREDNGCYIRDAMKACHRKGAADEKWWPYRGEKVFDMPPLEAQRFKIKGYKRVEPHDIAAMKTALADENPIVIGGWFDLRGDFKGTRLNVPSRKPARAFGHAMLIVGHRKNCNGSLEYCVRNSWGDDWAENGHIWIDSRYFQKRRGLVFEAWVITPKEAQS